MFFINHKVYKTTLTRVSNRKGLTDGQGVLMMGSIKNNKTNMKILPQEAQHLLTTGAPISESKTDLAYLTLQLISDGQSPERIAERLGEPLDAVNDVMEKIYKEFLS